MLQSDNRLHVMACKTEVSRRSKVAAQVSLDRKSEAVQVVSVPHVAQRRLPPEIATIS